MAIEFKQNADADKINVIRDRLVSTEKRMYPLRRVHKRNRLMILGAHYHRYSYEGDDVYIDYQDMLRRRFVVNWVLVYVEKMITLLTSNSPGLEVMSNSDNDCDIQSARRCSGFLKWYLDKTNFIHKLTEFLHFTFECGKGVFFMGFDNRRDLPDYGVVSPYFYLRDLSVSAIEDASWAAHSVYMQKREFESRYGDKIDMERLTALDIGEGSTGMAGENLNEADRGLPGGQSQKDYYRVYYYFERPTNPDDPSTGYYCIFEPETKQIIEDGDYPYKHGQLPYVELDDIVYGGRGWPQTHIQHITPINQTINKLQSQIIEFVELQTIPRLLADDDSGINPEALQMGPGGIVWRKPSARVDFFPMANLPPGTFTVFDQLERATSLVSTVDDIWRGEIKSQTPWRALETMLDHTRNKHGNLIVRFAQMMSRFGVLTLSNTKQFMRDPKLVRVEGTKQKVETFLFRDSDIPVDQQVKVDISSITNQSRAGMWEMVTHLIMLGLLNDPVTGQPDRELIFRLLNMSSLEAIFTEKSDEQVKVAEMQIDAIKAGEEPLPVFEYDDHETIYKTLKSEIQSIGFRRLPPHIQQALVGLAKEHEKYINIQRAEEPRRQVATAFLAQQLGQRDAMAAMSAAAGGQQGPGRAAQELQGMAPPVAQQESPFMNPLENPEATMGL